MHAHGASKGRLPRRLSRKDRVRGGARTSPSAAGVSAATVPRRLVLVGSVVVDVSLRVDRLPDRGGDLLARTTSISAGGGMFVLQAAVNAGLPAMYAGRHGSGPFGAIVRSALAEAGIETAYETDPAGDTGPCIVLVEPDGERTMITSNGVEAALGPDRLEQIEIRDDDAVYVSGYDLAYPVTGPAVVAWLPRLPAAALLVCDPGPLVSEIRPDVLGPVLARTDVLTLNSRESTALSGSAGRSAGGADLLGKIAPAGVVVVRAGSQGATLIESGARPLDVPGRPVKAADTTGAGDTHTGALTAARAAGSTWAAAVESANVAAAAFLVRSAH
jgi:sugar/nucleoside kinase (ribokinase family)